MSTNPEDFNLEEYLLTSEYSLHKKSTGSISAAELHEAIMAIPAVSKLLLLDTHFSSQLAGLARRTGDYFVIFAAGPGQYVADCPTHSDQQNAVHGLFTFSLTQQLMRADIEQMTYEDLMKAVADTCLTSTRSQNS